MTFDEYQPDQAGDDTALFDPTAKSNRDSRVFVVVAVVVIIALATLAGVIIVAVT